MTTDDERLGQLFKDSMSRLASGVVIVTSFVDGQPWGLTVTACCSVSVEPPMFLVSLARPTASTTTILEQGRFGVSILDADGLDVAQAGAASGVPKYIGEFCKASRLNEDERGRRSPTPPEIAGSLAHLDCDVAEAFEVSDHVLFVGRVTAVYGHVAIDDGQPPAALVHYRREYYSLSSEQMLDS